MLAKVYLVDEGALFVSRIDWLPSDQLTLRPWERDRLMANGQMQLMDDAVLTDWLDHLEAWGAGLPANGDRWLADGPVATVRDVLSEPAGPGGWLPGLWTRCRRHPRHMKALDRHELLCAVRAARLPRR